MNREYRRWYSPLLGRDAELLIFGQAGARVLAFPTAKGRFFDWENNGMISALGEYLERGWFQLFCVDSADAESWFAQWAHPNFRAWRHGQYEQYILHEVLPLTTSCNPHSFLITTGIGFGAYHAVNLAFRHPHLVGRVIGMSGIYDISEWTENYPDDKIYFNNPCVYLPNEHEPERIEALRRIDLILAVGRDDPRRRHSEQLSSILWKKNIRHVLRLWDGWANHWPSWQQMIRLYIGGRA
jgi:esterase/lipase superfamily enzyme